MLGVEGFEFEVAEGGVGGREEWSSEALLTEKFDGVVTFQRARVPVHTR